MTEQVIPTPVPGAAPVVAPAADPVIPAEQPVDPSEKYKVSGITDQNDLQYLANKGNPDLKALFESYKGLEGMLGAKDRLILKPSEKSSPAEIADYKAKMGIPSDHTKYTAFETTPEAGREDLFKFFNESKMSDTQVTSVLNKLKQTKEDRSYRKNQEDAKGVTALASEWGDEYNTRVSKVNATATELGVDALKLQKIRSVLGVEATYKMFDSIAGRSREDSFISPTTGKASQDDHARYQAIKRKLMTEKNISPSDPIHAEFKKLQNAVFK